MTADRDLAEDRLHGSSFRHGCIGECAQIILDRSEILHHIRIAHGEYDGATGGAIENRVSKDPVASSMATVFVKPPPAPRIALPAVGTTYTAAITCSAASTASTTGGFMPAAERAST